MGTPVVRCKDGVRFCPVIPPGGIRILAAIDQCCRSIGLDLVITSAADGAHSGPDDPHHRGEAYDVRTHGFSRAQAEAIVAVLGQTLGPAFYAFLEAPGEPGEHVHVQVRKGTVYPPKV